MRMLSVRPRDAFHENKKVYRLVIRVDDVTHEIIKLDGNSLSVTFACEPNLAVLVDPNTAVYEHGEIDIDCMSCLVKRSWL